MSSIVGAGTAPYIPNVFVYPVFVGGKQQEQAVDEG